MQLFPVFEPYKQQFLYVLSDKGKATANPGEFMAVFEFF